MKLPFSGGGKASVIVGGFMALAITIVAGFEGLYPKAYRDPVGIPTICYGHIEGVRMGDTMTVQQCKDLLATDLVAYDKAMMACVKVPLSPQEHAAYLSFAYNVGTGGWCKSTSLRKLNAGDRLGACDGLLAWNKATKNGRKIVLPGLDRRRKEERILCRSGVRT